MREIRPIHSGFETLRLRRQNQRREAAFNLKSYPTNEQLTALGYVSAFRKGTLFEQGHSR